MLKGRVTDASGAGMPYAAVFLDGTTTGSTTNATGEYQMTVQAGLCKVICHYIGYEQATAIIDMPESGTVVRDFVLHPQTLEMRAVDIHANAEDPAYEIIRRTIAKRKEHLEQAKTFQATIYLKTVGRSRSLPDKFMGKKIKTPDLDVDSLGRGVLYLAEEYADYYASGDRENTVIRSVTESGNSSGLGLAKLPPVISFYKNNVKLYSPRGSVSPIAENAFYYYKFKYLGQFEEQGHIIDKVQVTPKRQFEPCFNGTIFIDEDGYWIHSLDLTLVKTTGVDVFDTLKITQMYLPDGKGLRVIKSQLIYVTAKIFAFDITGNLSALYENPKINEPIPDSVFNSKLAGSYDKNAIRNDTAYWNHNRPVPLQTDELKNFRVQDSLNKIVDNPHYADSVRRQQNRLKALDVLLLGKTFNGPEFKDRLTFRGLLGVSNYNIVEGFNLAPRVTWRHTSDTGHNWFITNAARYGFSNTHLNDIVRLYYTSDDPNWQGRRWLAGIEGGKYVFQYNPDNPVYPIMNSLSALFLRENDLKIYERWEGTAFAERRFGNGFVAYARASWQRRLPLQNTTYFSFASSNDGTFLSNLPPHLTQITTWAPNDAMLFHASLSWQPGFRYIQYPKYKTPIPGRYPKFTVTYDKGIPDVFGSVSNYDKYKVTVTGNMKLNLLGSLSYKLGVGGFLNSNYVSIPDLDHPYGNRGLGFASPYLESFQFMQYYDYSNIDRQYGEAHLEYKLKGLLSNKLPLMREAGFSLVAGGNFFYSNDRNYYSEAFVGIDNIGWKAARLFRLDFVQSWDSNGGHNSGLRLGFSTSSALSVNFGTDNETHSEW